MAAQGFSKKEYASLLGIFQGQYSTMINVPLSISSALAASLVPSLVATVQTGSRKQVHNKINTVSRLYGDRNSMCGWFYYAGKTNPEYVIFYSG